MQMELLGKEALNVIGRLCEGGFLAYLVGGCVRDVMRGHPPADWDVATSARPEEVAVLFERCLPTGVRHGTVTIVMDKVPVDVTTFRQEGGYTDGRHPDSVSFGCLLEEDLSRRDFTINAMALDGKGRIVDPFGGADDLQNRCIRCVGEPTARFREDALRIWRGLRLAATLNFTIEDSTKRAMAACAPLTRVLSAERVSAEIQKVLLSQGAEHLDEALAIGLLDDRLTGRPSIVGCARLNAVPPRPDIRWAGFAALLREAGCLADMTAFFRRLRLPRRTSDPAAAGALQVLEGAVPRTPSAWRTLCHREGVETATCAAAIADMLTPNGGYAEAVQRVLDEKPCLDIKSLAISGRHLCEKGYAGEAVGAAQRRLMAHVLDHPENNRPDVLWAVLENSGT